MTSSVPKVGAPSATANPGRSAPRSTDPLVMPVGVHDDPMLLVHGGDAAVPLDDAMAPRRLRALLRRWKSRAEFRPRPVQGAGSKPSLFQRNKKRLEPLEIARHQRHGAPVDAEQIVELGPIKIKLKVVSAEVSESHELFEKGAPLVVRA